VLEVGLQPHLAGDQRKQNSQGQPRFQARLALTSEKSPFSRLILLTCLYEGHAAVLGQPQLRGPGEEHAQEEGLVAAGAGAGLGQ